MFGEEEMFGQTVQTIDKKTRLILPSLTKREEGDKLLLIEDKELNIYRIFRKEIISGVFAKNNEDLLNAKKSEEILKIKKELLELSKKVLKSLEVDKNGRVVLGENFKNAEKVNVIGASDHIILELKK